MILPANWNLLVTAHSGRTSGPLTLAYPLRASRALLRGGHQGPFARPHPGGSDRRQALAPPIERPRPREDLRSKASRPTRSRRPGLDRSGSLSLTKPKASRRSSRSPLRTGANGAGSFIEAASIAPRFPPLVLAGDRHARFHVAPEPATRRKALDGTTTWCLRDDALQASAAATRSGAAGERSAPAGILQGGIDYAGITADSTAS